MKNYKFSKNLILHRTINYLLSQVATAVPIKLLSQESLISINSYRI